MKNYINPIQILGISNVPEAQVKEIMNKICDKVVGKNRKYNIAIL